MLFLSLEAMLHYCKMILLSGIVIHHQMYGNCPPHNPDTTLD